MMFNERTVILTGAGASCDLGYPTGEKLIDSIKSQIKSGLQGIGKVNLNNSKDCYMKYPFGDTNHLMQFLNFLEEFRPTNIDRFLKYHPQFQQLGKDFIAGTIIDSEDVNSLKNKSWYRYLLEGLISGCQQPKDLLKNKLTIITFNYDISIEWYLYDRLSKISFFKDDKSSIVNDFFSELKIIHAFGQVGVIKEISQDKLDSSCRNYSDYGNMKRTSNDILRQISKNLSVIDEKKHNSLQNDAHIELCKSAIQEAQNLFIIGFGFDDYNNKLIFPEIGQMHNLKKVCYTNFNNSPLINYRVRNIFATNDEIFDRPFVRNKHGDQEFILLRSDKGANEAIGLDFSFI